MYIIKKNQLQVLKNEWARQFSTNKTKLILKTKKKTNKIFKDFNPF